MSASKTESTKEVSILNVIRELTSSKPVESKPNKIEDADRKLPDPHTLLASLEKKRELLNLLDGCMIRTDITDMKKQLNQAIADLEEIISS